MLCSSGVRHPIDSFGRCVALLLPARQRKFAACLHTAVRARRAVYTPITCSRVSYAPPDAQRAIHCSSSFRQCSRRYPLLLSARKRGLSSSAARSRALPACQRRQVLAGQLWAVCTRWCAGSHQSPPPSFARTALHAQHPPGTPNHQRSRQRAGVARVPCSLLARPGRLQQLVPEHTEVARTFARTDSMRAFQHWGAARDARGGCAQRL